MPRSGVGKRCGQQSKTVSREVSPEDSLSSGMSGLSLEEQEKKAMTDIAHMYVPVYIYTVKPLQPITSTDRSPPYIDRFI